MKRLFFNLLLSIVLIFGLSACHIAMPKDLPELPTENWRFAGETSENNIPQIQIPEYYQNRNFEQTLTLALENINDPYYELVWGEPQETSPDGAFAVYISNKDDIAVKDYSMMLLDLTSMEELVLFRTDSLSLYPLWWIDNTRFVYEQDSTYYICDIYKSSTRIPLVLEGENALILAYDGSSFMYTENANDIENSNRIILNILKDNQAIIIAKYNPAGEKLMAESAINETLKLMVLKMRTATEYDRRLMLYDYKSGQSRELEPPIIKDATKLTAVDFEWEGKNLIVNYQVDYVFKSKVERWIYLMPEGIVG